MHVNQPFILYKAIANQTEHPFEKHCSCSSRQPCCGQEEQPDDDDDDGEEVSVYATEHRPMGAHLTVCAPIGGQLSRQVQKQSAEGTIFL